jgi:ribosome biogenesis GTPase A
MRIAEKAIRKLLKEIDLVIEVLDSRAVTSSTNLLLHEIVKDKPKLIILNKCDLSDPQATQSWVEYFTKQQNKFVLTHFKNDKNSDKIIKICKNIVPSRNSYIKPLRIMITGVPNVGKSTIINMLNKKNIAKVADLPGVTRTNQFIYIAQDILLIDTPGLTWHKIDEQDVGNNLSLCNSIGVRAFDVYLLAIYLIEFLCAHNNVNIQTYNYKQLFQTRYNLSVQELLMPAAELIAIIGRKRGCLLKANEVDVNKASSLIVQDFRLGRIGRISLETTGSMTSTRSFET